MRIIVGGLAGLFPVGGVAWDYLQYVIGLSRMGHDVFYYEDTWSWPYHPVEKTHTDDATYSAGFLDRFFAAYAPDLRERWHYLHLNETTFGMSSHEFTKVAATADIFLNVSGACRFPKDLSQHCRKVFLDTDPGYNQIVLAEKFAWSENVERWCEHVRNHDQFFTYAENIHAPDSLVPKLEFAWETTRMPVVLDLWAKVTEEVLDDAPFTSVMTWNAFKGRLIYQGREYQSKGREFEKLVGLPSRVATRLKIAVGGLDAPLDRLRAYGWDIVDGPEATLTAEQYREFIGCSRGEISVAKHVYVALRTGWFSCRSACYLAAGRPVVVQDTGFSSYLPTGLGLLAFGTVDEAVNGIELIQTDYRRHQQAAREVARTHFDSHIVLSRMLARIGA